MSGVASSEGCVVAVSGPDGREGPVVERVARLRREEEGVQ